MPSIYWISGPPASGKTTLCAALSERFEKAIHVPVDDLRTWVCRGMADSVPWTEETERQFQLAEAAVCDVARRYHAAGFNVLIDHCRNPQRLEEVIAEHLEGIEVVKVCLMPDLDTNLRRSHTRGNKPFDPHMLDETIVFTNTRYRVDPPAGWLMIDNSRINLSETIDRIHAAP
jgi:adenylate kinase family enzyme